MHDPLSVVKDFKIGEFYLLTIWHVDPCTDGTDNSCGWSIRTRHGNLEIRNKIRTEFEYNLKNNYWFYHNGAQKFSTVGTLVLMYKTAAWIYFERNSKKVNKFLNEHLLDIIHLAENPHDCIGDIITNKYNAAHPERMGDLLRLSDIVFSDILTKTRKWYQHPRWHIHHWKIQFTVWRSIKWFWNKRFGKKYDNVKVPNSNVDDNLRATV